MAEKKGALSKEIGFKKKGALSKDIGFKKKVKIPTKRNINFVEITESNGIKWQVAIPLIVLIIVVAVLVAKFAVIDQFAKLNAIQSENVQIQSNIDMMNAQIAKFDDIKAEYAHYTYSDMTEEELSRADRKEVLGLINKYVLPSAVLDSWVVNGNTLVINITGITLAGANNIVSKMGSDPIVTYCTVQTATTDNEVSTVINSKITATLTVASEEGGAE